MKLLAFSLVVLEGLNAAKIDKLEAILSWTDYQTKYDKKYTRHEVAGRYENFIETTNFIRQHNQKFLEGKETYYTGVNEFADMSREEYDGRNNYVEEHPVGSTYTCMSVYFPPGGHITDPCLECQEVSSKEDGDAIDDMVYLWSDPALNNQNANWVTAMKDQGSCGSCWAFAASAALEGQFCRKGYEDCNTWGGISEQNFVDCNMCDDNTGLNPLTGFVCSFGCGGGWSQNAWYYAKLNGGCDTNDAYPYESGTTRINGACRYTAEGDAFPSSKRIVEECVQVGGRDQNYMMQAVNEEGPIKISINASSDGFRTYAGGVFYDPNCSESTNHAVTITGYGVEDGEKYWMVKNSWGTSYGLGGYIKMGREMDNLCGLGSYPYWPRID